jgi:hypothetical protein
MSSSCDANQNPWCVLHPHCTTDSNFEYIDKKVYTDTELNQLLAHCLDPATTAASFGDNVYLLVNKCVRQRFVISLDTAWAVVRRMNELKGEFTTIVETGWMTSVLLDLYEQNQHVLASPDVHACITYLIHVLSVDNTDDMAEQVLTNATSALVTLVSGLFCYGLTDDLESLDLPVQFDRPSNAKNLEELFDAPEFCRGLVQLLLQGACWFDKWLTRNSLFHWDLAIISLVVRNRVLRVDALCEAFEPKVLERLFDASADYSSLIIASKTRPLPWKRTVLECVSIVLTGSPTYLLGIALVDQSSGIRRFGIFIHALLKYYGTVKSVREACLATNGSPPALARAAAMLMSLSGRDHDQLSRMIRRLRHHPGVGVEEDVKEEKRPELSEHERDTIMKELIEQEEEEKRTSMASSKTSVKKKKAKKKNVKKSDGVTPQAHTAASPVSDTDDDDDACIYNRLGLNRTKTDDVPSTTVDPAPTTPVPFGQSAKKRDKNRRKIATKPVLEPIREPVREPVRETLVVVEPVREPPVVLEPVREPVREPIVVLEPIVEAVWDYSKDREWTGVSLSSSSSFDRTPGGSRFCTARWCESGTFHPFPERRVRGLMDVLRWTPLVYAHSVRRSFEKQSGVVHSF